MPNPSTATRDEMTTLPVDQIIHVPRPNKVQPPHQKFRDPCSCSRPGKIQTVHLHLRMHVDFHHHQLTCIATLTFRLIDSTVTTVSLDTRGLIITLITDAETGSELPFEWGHKTPTCEPLIITLPHTPQQNSANSASGRHDQIPHARISIAYKTNGLGNDAVGGACDWLPADQAGGLPFIFTQAQTIHARSIFPCQDTPAAKAPYSAVVSISPYDPQLQVVMSALRVTSHEEDPPQSFRFECNVPVPSYLIAFAIGRLKFKDISHRCRVWGLPHIVDDAAWEFAEVETFLQTAENIAGPYVWGRYDILVPPPSFPCGGMENPMLTFVTPTLISVRTDFTSYFRTRVETDFVRG